MVHSPRSTPPTAHTAPRSLSRHHGGRQAAACRRAGVVGRPPIRRVESASTTPSSTGRARPDRHRRSTPPLGLAGCMAADVVDILRKGRHPLTGAARDLHGHASRDSRRAGSPRLPCDSTSGRGACRSRRAGDRAVARDATVRSGTRSARTSCCRSAWTFAREQARIPRLAPWHLGAHHDRGAHVRRVDASVGPAKFNATDGR